MLIAALFPEDVPTDTKIAEPLKIKILQKLVAENAKGYVDWISLSIALKFRSLLTIYTSSHSNDASTKELIMRVFPFS